nr:transposase [Ipomoea batatas]
MDATYVSWIWHGEKATLNNSIDDNDQIMEEEHKFVDEDPIDMAPRQPDSSQCGFYVMAYMRTLIEHMPDIDDKESVQALFQQADYNQTDIDQVRSEWADSVSSYIQ